MKKLIWLLLPLLLLPLCALGDTARDITGECRFVVPNNKGNVPYLRDRNEMTAASAEAYRYPHITINVGETPVAAVYVEFGRNPMPFDVLKKVGGEWVVIARSDEGEYAQHYAEFEPFRIRFDTGNMARTLVVREAFTYHKSQNQDKFSVPGPGEACDSTLYTLARSTVGEDSAGGDFLENIPAECLR